MLIIGEVLVEEAVMTERFRCDLPRCRGACCTLQGPRGAPLLDEEKEMVERVLPAVTKYLSPASLALLRKKGPVEGFPGSYATTCIGDRDCVFVMYEGNVAKCSIEHACARGEISWRKPVSCHLFPLRYADASPGLLRYESIPECSAGRESGDADGTPLREFVREALVRRFGEGWVGRLEDRCRVPDGPALNAACAAGARGGG